MVMEYSNGQIHQNMRVNGKMIRLVEKEKCFTQMEIPMMENGWMIKHMARVFM